MNNTGTSMSEIIDARQLSGARQAARAIRTKEINKTVIVALADAIIGAIVDITQYIRSVSKYAGRMIRHVRQDIAFSS